MTRPTETPRVTNLPDRTRMLRVCFRCVFSRRINLRPKTRFSHVRHLACAATVPPVHLLPTRLNCACVLLRHHLHALVLATKYQRPCSGGARARPLRPPRPLALTKAGCLSPRQATRSDRGHMWLFDYLWSMLNALGALQHCSDSHGAVLRLRCCSSRSRCGCARASQVWLTRTPRFSSLAWTMPARRRCCTCSRTSASRSTTRRSIRVRALPDSD